MKRKYYLYSLFCGMAACALTVLTACQDNDAPQPQPATLTITAVTGSNDVMQLDTLLLTADASLTGLSHHVWQVDGKTVSEENVCSFTHTRPGTYTVTLTAIDDSGRELTATRQVQVTERFSNGIFVLNEGNMTNETGTLTFISNAGILTDSAYYRINGKLLGNVCQDLCMSDGKIYIISQNGAKNGGEGLLTIAQAGSLEKVEVYNDDSNTLSWPSNIAVTGNEIYLRDNAGIYLLQLEDRSLKLVEGTKGAAKARMAVIGDKVFAMNGQKLQVIQGGGVSREIDLPGKPSGVVRSYDGQLWVSCTSPASILKINPDNYTAEAHNITEGTLSMGWGTAPAFAATQDTLYYSNAGFKLYRHIFSQNKTEAVADIQESLPDAQLYYNSLGVNPANGQVIFATLKGYGMDYQTNDIGVFDFGQQPTMLYDFKGANSFPAGVYATASFE